MTVHKRTITITGDTLNAYAGTEAVSAKPGDTVVFAFAKATPGESAYKAYCAASDAAHSISRMGHVSTFSGTFGFNIQTRTAQRPYSALSGGERSAWEAAAYAAVRAMPPAKAKCDDCGDEL